MFYLFPLEALSEGGGGGTRMKLRKGLGRSQWRSERRPTKMGHPDSPKGEHT